MQPFLGLFFSALLTTGASLKCEVCSSTGNNCSGHLQTCSAGQDTCAVVLSETSLGVKIKRIVKYCESSRFCRPGPATMHLGQERSIISSGACCVGDDCSNITLKLPTERSISNGKHCPSCYSVSNSCPKAMVDCMGTNNYCFRTVFHAAHDPKNTTMKGCTTKSVCDGLKRKEVFLGGFAVNVQKTVCKRASKSPPSTGYPFLALLGFLLKMSLLD